MPMKMPFGPDSFQKISWPIPTAMMSAPGFNALATGLMKKLFKDKGVASIPDMRAMCVEAGVTMIACQMTIDLFEFDKSEFIDGIEFGGAATFLEFAGGADITLFI